MGDDPQSRDSEVSRPYQVVDLNYVSLYFKDYGRAIGFYTQAFGAPEVSDDERGIHGWRMGATWLTLFPSNAGIEKDGNPSNAEFAVQVSAPGEVDALYRTLINLGARDCMAPRDTEMYEPMRFACVDDPFGVRIDVYCLRPGS